MKIAFFPGCLVDMFYPEIGVAAVEVLERLGCEVELPKEQVCCGQPLLNSGFSRESIPMMKNMIDAYDGFDTIVSLTGSCMFAIQEDYTDFLQDEPVYLARQQKLAPRIHEFSDFIVNTLGVTDVGAHLDAKVTYHKSCHLTRFLGVEEAPMQLLRAVDGLQLVEMDRADRCCGFGGTFAVKESEISTQMVREKCRTILDSGADVVCVPDPSCLLNIKGALSRMKDEGETDRIPDVMHVAEILNS